MRNKVSYLSNHSWPMQNFTSTGEHILQCQCEYCAAELAYPFEMKEVLKGYSLRSGWVTHEFHVRLMPFHFLKIQFQVPQAAFLEKSALISFETVVHFLVTIAESGNQEMIYYHFHSFQTLYKLVHSALSHFRHCADAKRHHVSSNRSDAVSTWNMAGL